MKEEKQARMENRGLKMASAIAQARMARPPVRVERRSCAGCSVSPQRTWISFSTVGVVQPGKSSRRRDAVAKRARRTRSPDPGILISHSRSPI